MIVGQAFQPAMQTILPYMLSLVRPPRVLTLGHT